MAEFNVDDRLDGVEKSIREFIPLRETVYSLRDHLGPVSADLYRINAWAEEKGFGIEGCVVTPAGDDAKHATEVLKRLKVIYIQLESISRAVNSARLKLNHGINKIRATIDAMTMTDLEKDAPKRDRERSDDKHEDRGDGAKKSKA